MSTYAEVAASAPGVSDNDNPNSNQNSNQNFNQNLNNLQNDLQNDLSHAKDKLRKSINSNLSDDQKKKIKETKSSIARFFEYLFNKTSNAAYTITEELKNPIVATQSILTIGAIAGGIFAYHERARIRRIPDDVLNVYAAILTGAVLVDGLLFKSLYPKYKKY
ncbi:uncharacterized protein ASCRUDRAFT_6641 [Ascoidea rubescens DSM 1968]|uniref:Mitochondrial outer membrane protein OM14 C-terminal domain-containing protein n=1 Tax=Ascoidea rubescens DSM 1968 TaxID=1344418 RepID=A0A1D2VN80_9ASCO|nr:hypothetical protein ASCRUDRAFT_6641 [Ascoidea rubescens DSM 1968]ODV63049.1 hypothetical protein ASCRUDRAFT_6641 [Ascoidea rubescens DSM 1968]